MDRCSGINRGVLVRVEAPNPEQARPQIQVRPARLAKRASWQNPPARRRPEALHLSTAWVNGRQPEVEACLEAALDLLIDEAWSELRRESGICDAERRCA